MANGSPAVRLGGVQLGRSRHVCAVFDGADDAAAVIVPFVLDRLDAGDRVVHLVESRDAALTRLGPAVDVPAAVESGQLDVRSWSDSYLEGGAFSRPRMLATIRRSLRDGQARGFPATRLIGDMGWAREGVPGVGDLIAYETEVDAILARPRVSVVCAYDAQQHSAGRIAAVLAIHDAGFVDGELRPGTAAGPAASPRGRILAAASVLFAENGIGRAGVDSLIEAAGVAKATFYRQFPSKDALVLAWLQDPRTRWFDRVRAGAEERAATPDDLVPRLFEAVAEWLETGDFVGCPYLNAAVEVSDPRHPVAGAIRDYLAEIGDFLEAAVRTTGRRDAARLGRELHALLAGSITLGVANRSSSHVLVARDAALQLLTAERSRTH
jgi:AcrR family transcriptional regulator